MAHATRRWKGMVAGPLQSMRRAAERRCYARRARCGTWGDELGVVPDRLACFAEGGTVELLGCAFTLTDDNVWSISPDNGYRWPRKHRKDFDLASEETGDYKVIWELGRLQFLPGLIAADRATGEAVLRSFLDADDPVRTIHWYSEMEIGLRMISLMLTIPLLERSSPLRRRVVESVNVHYHFLRDHLTTWWPVRNNHILVEVAALLAYEMLFVGDHGRHGEHWRVLLREAHDQIYHDGGVREQSTAYARFNLDAFLLLWVLGERIGGETPAWLKRLVENMLEHMADLRRPDGLWPPIGDADDGRAIPTACGRDRWDFGGHLAVGAVLCNRPEFKAAAAGWDNDFAWLLGDEYAGRFDALPLRRVAGGGQLYRESGYWIWRGGADGADYLLLRAGEFGLGGDGAAPHSHCDELSITATFDGRPLLIDAGTFTYDGRRGPWRKAFRANAAHNVVEVNGWPQAEAPAGANFCWARVPVARIEEAGDNHAIATFSDYDNRYAWTRRAEAADGRLRVSDSLRMDGDAELRWWFNLAPDVKVELDDAGATLSDDGRTYRLELVEPRPGARWRTEQGWFSPGYRRREPIARVAMELQANEHCEVQWTIERTS